MLRSTILLTCCGLLAGCAANSGAPVAVVPNATGANARATVGPAPSVPAAATMMVGQATLKNAAGQAVGTATVSRSGNDLKVAVSATGMPPGVHGIHLHMVGQCEAPAFTSAGGHWNPMGKMHGQDNPAGKHDGDLPNISIGADGSGTLEAIVAGGAHQGAGALLDADGASVVVHAAADDYKTDPSGNSGARIACGVLQAGV